MALMLTGSRMPASRISEHCEFAWSIGPDDRRPAGGAAIPADGRVEVLWTEVGIVVGGHVTRPVVTNPDWPPVIHGLQLRVGRAGAVLGADAGELVREPVMLTDLWGREAELLAERVAEQDSAGAALGTLVRGLAERTPEVRADPIVDHVASRAANPGTRFSEVAGQVGYSERQLRRRFRDAVGFGPKMLQRIERFQRFVRMSHAVAGVDLARLAADLGYTDESHLGRDSRELAGVAPGAFAPTR